MTNRHSYPDKVIIFVTVSSSLVMILFCTLEDSQADYQVSFSDGAFALAMSASLAFFTVHAKRYLPKATIAELLYLLNFSCVLCLPFIALLFGELPALKFSFSKRNIGVYLQLVHHGCSSFGKPGSLSLSTQICNSSPQRWNTRLFMDMDHNCCYIFEPLRYWRNLWSMCLWRFGFMPFSHFYQPYVPTFTGYEHI
ncbi:hypothetical protein OS493_021799 [Desmophyllum pertusum]|uniref:Uncharacterized protein n=1 Tax=Desmophyllum pertusum TaxID=174260 RepID=A0A9W9ZMF5_9CNID|nr:hypothetical protein OS493_021799 [Desmophyllum pertusum]